MMRILLTGAALSLAAGLAQAQAPSTKPSAAPPAATPPASTQVNPPSAAAPPATDTTATVSPYKMGMQIKDAQVQVIGTIAKVVKTPDGATTITASVDGRNVNLPASALTPGTDGGAISSMSKAQITSSTTPST